MHLSTHNWMRAEPLATTLERNRRCHIESIEISGEPAQYPAAETRKLLDESGIRCWGAVTLQLGDRNLAAIDPAQRARSVAYVKSVVEMVAALGGQIVTVVPATVGKVVPDGRP
ncbi:MAG: TIM barrel protein, partial [Acetobacteraceae bacterium]